MPVRSQATTEGRFAVYAGGEVSTTTATRERPILFRGDMVRAILDGRKTQTRRLLKWKVREPGLNLNFSGLDLGYYANDLPSTGWVLRSRDGRGTWNDRTFPIHCPYGSAGDRLWVRETWSPDHTSTYPFDKIVYRADGRVDDHMIECSCVGEDKKRAHPTHDCLYPFKWRPSIFMRRAACRLELEVTGIRIERLNEITEADVAAEGFGSLAKITATEAWQFTDRFRAFNKLEVGANPWLWVIEFKRTSFQQTTTKNPPGGPTL